MNEDPKGRLRETTTRMLTENPEADIAIAIMLSGRSPQGNGFQVSMRVPNTRETHELLISTLHGLANYLQDQGPVPPAEVKVVS